MDLGLSFQWGTFLGLTLSAVIALLVPVGLVLALRWRTGAPWVPLGIGAAVFAVTQLGFRLEVLEVVDQWAGPWLRRQPSAQVGWMGLHAASAALVEEVGRYLGYRWFLEKERTWRVGVMYGLGHGGCESIVLVGSSVATLLLVYVGITLAHLPDSWLPAGERNAVVAQFQSLSFGMASLGGVERLSSLAFHVGMSLVVLRGVNSGRWGWLALAIGLHGASDFVGAGLAPRFAGPYWAEVVIGAFGLIGLLLTAFLPIPAAPPLPPRSRRRRAT